MVYRDYWALSQWYAHYSRHLGGANLYVVAHGADPMIQTICKDASVLTIPRETFEGFDRVRGRLLNSIQDGLGEVYDWVIRTDADELVCLDPKYHTGFSDLFAKHSERALFALGLNVVEADGDAELDGDERVLAKRRTVILSGHYSKAWAVRDRIALMRHGVEIRAKRVQRFKYCMPQGVYLAHLKYANIAALNDANETRQSVAASDGKGLPGKAWKNADANASKFFAKVADLPETDWEHASTEAYDMLSTSPVRDVENGLVRTQSIKFGSRTTLPEWFMTI